jgi:hypothetical protein
LGHFWQDALADDHLDELPHFLFVFESNGILLPPYAVEVDHLLLLLLLPLPLHDFLAHLVLDAGGLLEIPQRFLGLGEVELVEDCKQVVDPVPGLLGEGGEVCVEELVVEFADVEEVELVVKAEVGVVLAVVDVGL